MVPHRESNLSTSTHKIWPPAGASTVTRREFSILRGWRSLFSLSPAAASFDLRRFHAGDTAARARLERIGEMFIAGFNHALRRNDPSEMRDNLQTFQPDLRGFAAEGAAMGYAVADAVMLGGDRLRTWVDSTAADFTYLTHVGAGWALARVPWRRRAILGCLDPVHHWLAYDGLGFHDAYFSSRRIASGWRRIRAGYAAQSYDQGVGRAIWFLAGGSVERAIELISHLEPARRPDLWAGLGLALTYAGGAGPGGLRLAAESAGSARPCLAQGAAFAAEARARANHVPPHTGEAVQLLAGVDFGEAVRAVRKVRASLPPVERGETPRYELWRRGVRQALGPAGGARHA
jgi:enediyne biosynthesis protein E3